MPLIPVTCVTAACDVCEAQYYEPEEYSVHFEDAAQARERVRDAGWLITTEGQVICDAADAEHGQAVDDLLSATPDMPTPGQLALGETSLEEGR